MYPEFNRIWKTVKNCLSRADSCHFKSRERGIAKLYEYIMYPALIDAVEEVVEIQFD
jgi:hypothetical protein